MGKESKIEWTEATWNPWHGCHKVSQGCKNCYMFRDKARYGQDPNVVVRSKDATFYAPLKWKEPRTIFTCSWSDFFIEDADAWRDEAFAVMALTPQHTYQILTKRPERMLEWFSNRGSWPLITMIERLMKFEPPRHESRMAFAKRNLASIDWPLPNCWLGVSVEDQKTADERIPLLLQTPAALRWLSVEPLLGSVKLPECDGYSGCPLDGIEGHGDKPFGGIDWAVVGGESGSDARPMDPEWVRSIRDQCSSAAVPFFFKQGSQANWPHFKDFDKFPEEFQIREFPK